MPRLLEKVRQGPMADSPANAVNVIATLGHNRSMSKAIQQFAAAVLGDGTVSRRQREMVILRMGWNCQAIYEFGQHSLFGREAGLTDPEIYALTRPLATWDWAPADLAALHLTDDVYADDCVSDPTWAEVIQHFDESQIIELLVSIGYYRMVSSILNSCGVALDDGVPGWPSPV